MDLTFLFEYINLVTLGICLCVGYAIKHAQLFEKIGNQYIPLSMLVVGCIINVLINFSMGINSVVVLGGMVSGLASTGLYELMRNLLEKDGEKETEGE